MTFRSSIAAARVPEALGSRRPVASQLRLLGLAAALCLALAACSKSKAPGETAGGKVIAEVGGRAIRADDLVAEASRRAESRRPIPAKEDLLREMIEREAFLQRARQAGLDRDPAYQREIESLLIRKLQASELDTRREAVTVTDEAVKAEYDANPDRYVRPKQARLALLFLAADVKSSEARRAEVRTRLEEGRQKYLALAATPSAKALAGFGPLAVDYSDDQVTRHRGGDLGWLESGKHPARVPAQVAETAWALPTGKVSEVIEAKDGFYVVLKTDSREPSVTPLESVQASLRQTLLVRKRKELEEQFRAGTARLFPSRVDTQALASVSLPEASPALATRNQESQPPGLPGTNQPHHGN